MKPIIKMIILLIGSCMAMHAEAATSTSSSVVTTTTTTNAVNDVDTKIIAAIYDKYAKDPALIGTTLTVNCQDGVVSLSGNVTAQSQADEAIIAAKSITGVKDVRSAINVATNPNIHEMNSPIKPANY